jgi:hypothetical protein
MCWIFIFIPLHSRSVSAHDGDVWRRVSDFFACLPRPFFKPKELANRAAASLWQWCRGQLARKEMYLVHRYQCPLSGIYFKATQCAFELRRLC